jgi:hypothetical protein
MLSDVGQRMDLFVISLDFTGGEPAIGQQRI